jgi:hypothetical protein
LFNQADKYGVAVRPPHPIERIFWGWENWVPC